MLKKKMLTCLMRTEGYRATQSPTKSSNNQIQIGDLAVLAALAISSPNNEFPQAQQAIVSRSEKTKIRSLGMKSECRNLKLPMFRSCTNMRREDYQRFQRKMKSWRLVRASTFTKSTCHRTLTKRRRRHLDGKLLSEKIVKDCIM